MLVYKYQRPYGLIAEVEATKLPPLPAGYTASIEVGVPVIDVYWDIVDPDDEVVANGFESSQPSAIFAIYKATQAL